jgi:nickel-dependent lactate racemase
LVIDCFVFFFRSEAMMDNPILFPYGEGTLSVSVPEKNLLGVIVPKQAAVERGDENEILCAALDHPIGAPPLRRLARKGQKVCIVTSDMTRPCPSERLLPLVLDELTAAGVPDEDIFIVMGLGLHRPMTDAEIDRVVGEAVHRRIRVLNHDAEDVVRLGVTSAGTPVEFFRAVVEADLRVCLGNLEFHWFAGYSGGAKAILPGVASRATVTANHSLMTRPGVGSGRIEGNPLRMDIEEGVAMLGVDFILNVVVDGEHKILDAVAGDLTAAHRRGCRTIAERGMAPVDRKADIVIASAGGFPKDINMYQAHKGLENAGYFVRDGGILILAAECREGWGNKTFEAWMKAASSPQDVLERIRQEFLLGGHKAAGIANIEQRAGVFLVSSMPGDQVEKMFMTPCRSLQEALGVAFDALGAGSLVLALPHAGSIIPTVG